MLGLSGSSNPAAQAIHRMTEYTGSHHLHPLTRVFTSPESISGNLGCPVERIEPPSLSFPCPPWLDLCIDPSALLGLLRVKDTPLNPSTIVVHATAVHFPSEGAGAEAFAPLPRSSLSHHIHDISSSTLPEAELVALLLAVRLAAHLLTPKSTDVHIFSSSQTAIASLHNPSKPTAGQHL